MNLAQRLGLRAANPTSAPREDVARLEAAMPPDVNQQAIDRADAAHKYGPEWLNSDQLRMLAAQRKVGNMTMDRTQLEAALRADDARKNPSPPLGWKPLTVASGESSRSPAKRRTKKAKSV